MADRLDKAFDEILIGTRERFDTNLEALVSAMHQLKDKGLNKQQSWERVLFAVEKSGELLKFKVGDFAVPTLCCAVIRILELETQVEELKSKVEGDQHDE